MGRGTFAEGERAERLADELETLDILEDIYGGAEKDTSFDFVNREFERNRQHPDEFVGRAAAAQRDTQASSFHAPLHFYPLSPLHSHGYSCLDLLELGKAYSNLGTGEFDLRRTRYYKACVADHKKLFKSTDQPDSGEAFAVRSASVTAKNPPVYLKRYAEGASDADGAPTPSLLSVPIEEVFR